MAEPTSWNEKAWTLAAGFAAALAYGFYDELTTRRRRAINVLTGFSVATFVGPWFCDCLGIASHNGMVAVSFACGLLGCSLARYVIETAEKNPGSVFTRFVHTVLGRFQPPDEKDKPK
jgi:hypothetical protein